MPKSSRSHAPIGRTPPQRSPRTNATDALIKSRTWKKLRLAVLAANPLCSDCLARGSTSPATEVHHRERRQDAPDRVFDWDNLEPLCERCHSSRTGRGE